MLSMNKEKAIAILFGLIMLFSLAGFGGLSLLGSSDQGQDPNNGANDIYVPTVSYEELDSQEKLYVLQTGRVLIESSYSLDCQECIENNALLESFARQFPAHVVVQIVETEEPPEIKMTGRNGIIQELTDVTETGIMDLFCSLAAVQPRECLFREL